MVIKMSPKFLTASLAITHTLYFCLNCEVRVLSVYITCNLLTGHHGLILILKSVFPVNMPDLIGIWSRSAGKQWPEVGQMILEHWLASKPDPFGQNLHSQPKLNQMRAGFAQYCLNRLWKNRTESEGGKTGSGEVVSCQKPDPVIPAHQLAF